eukprot:COSAG02_NODE_16677_length_1064_cov_2.459067_2_plen_110_part_00
MQGRQPSIDSFATAQLRRYLNKDGYGYVMSMDVSNVDVEPITQCTPKVELYIKGASVDPTRHVRGGWIDLVVDCQGVLWMSNLVAIWRYSLPPLHTSRPSSNNGLDAAA